MNLYRNMKNYFGHNFRSAIKTAFGSLHKGTHVVYYSYDKKYKLNIARNF